MSCRQERQRYYANRRLAIDSPNECISFIVDGMDQNKTNVPSLVRITKSCQNLWNLRTHLTGVLVHGSGSHCYFDCLQWSHDCNMTLCCILNTLSEISKLRPLPPKLMLQMDNCTRENKNKYVYAFLQLLVELDIFTEVNMTYIMYCNALNQAHSTSWRVPEITFVCVCVRLRVYPQRP